MERLKTRRKHKEKWMEKVGKRHIKEKRLKKEG